MLGNYQHNPPKDIGIVAMDAFIPKQYVDQKELEAFDGVAEGKYTIGLGQTKMAVCPDIHDINSICLTVVSTLMKKFNLSYADIGRVEVGTETIIDKSKSVKTVLMQLFKESGNSDVEGVDTTNACYGGTNALFNAVNWMESSYWDGRFALVIAADIAVYKTGAARPTGGAGAVAMLIGPNAPIVFDNGIRATYMDHVYDFYKPDLHSEYPVVDGPLSNASYITAVDKTFNLFLDKIEKRYCKGECEVNSQESGLQVSSENLADFYVFHSPYTKLVQKSFARLAFNDFRRHPVADEELNKFIDMPLEQTLANKELEKAFMTRTKKSFEQKVIPSLTLAKNLGNSYSASLYCGLASLLGGVESTDLLNKRLLLFSYGSGLAASMFSLKVVGSTDKIYKALNLAERLEARVKVSPLEFDEIMALREKVHNVKDYVPVSKVVADKGTFVLGRVDDKFRRTYVEV